MRIQTEIFTKPVIQETKQHFLKGEWVLPISHPPVKDGVVVINNNQIEGVLSFVDFQKNYPQKTCYDYGNAIILPGLINLHTHIEYSALHHLNASSELFAWINKLVNCAASWTNDDWHQSALVGAKEIALSGITCVADSAYKGTTAWALSKVGLRGIVGLELFGIDSSQADNSWNTWLEKYQFVLSSLNQNLVKLTVAPHAPYTVCPALWLKAKKWSQDNNLPLLTHLAESNDEYEWIKNTNETLDNFLETRNKNIQDIKTLTNWKGHNLSPVCHLEHNQLLSPNVIAAHAIQIDDHDLKVLSTNQIKIAHCPRSNSKLQNGTAPFVKMLNAGLKVGFGTDSSASVDNLDLLEEAHFAVNLHQTIDKNFHYSSEDIIYRLTLGAAEILGLSDTLGSLEPGKLADIAVFSFKEPAFEPISGPFDRLLAGEGKLHSLFVDGIQLVSQGEFIASK